MITELDTSQIDRLLGSELFGRIGCHSRGRTYVVPMTYVYDGRAIIGQTGNGLKVRMMRENPKVCFEVDRLHADGSWQSAIVHGRFEELHGEVARAALQRLLERAASAERWWGAPATHGAGRLVPWQEEGAARSEVIFQIVIDEKSGRSEVIERRTDA